MFKIFKWLRKRSRPPVAWIINEHGSGFGVCLHKPVDAKRNRWRKVKLKRVKIEEGDLPHLIKRGLY